MFPEEFGPIYQKDLCTLMWIFLSRLENCLPLQSFQQVRKRKFLRFNPSQSFFLMLKIKYFLSLAYWGCTYVRWRVVIVRRLCWRHFATWGIQTIIAESKRPHWSGSWWQVSFFIPLFFSPVFYSLLWQKVSCIYSLELKISVGLLQECISYSMLINRYYYYL